MMQSQYANLLRCLTGSLSISCLALALIGCEKPEEKVLDIETPGVDIEVHKTEDEPNQDVDVEAGEDQP